MGRDSGDDEGDAAAASVEPAVLLGGAHAKIEKTKGSRCKGDRAVVCKLGSLGPGKKVEIDLTVRPKAVGRLSVTSTATDSCPDASPGNNRAADTLRVSARR